MTEYLSEQEAFHASIPHVMGTRFDILIVGIQKKPAEMLWEEIERRLTALDRMLDRFNPASEVSKLNSGEESEPSAELAGMIGLAQEYKERTKGIFDISYGSPEMKYDFGGFAKGYAMREIKVLLEARGVTTAFVNFGDSAILGIGHHPYGDCWPVAADNPWNGERVAEFRLRDEALSTSGNTPGYSGHIVDPASGKRDSSHLLAAVISRDPLDAEVLSTVAMIAPESTMAQIMESFPHARKQLYSL